MADELIPGLSSSAINDVVGGLSTGIMWLIVLVGFMGIIAWLIYMMTFKVRVRIRSIVNGRTMIYDVKAKPIRENDGRIYWKLQRKVLKYNKMPSPPDDAIDIDKKGRKVFEVYLTEDGSFIPIKDNFNLERYKAGHDSFQPFTTQQRALLINEFKESDAYKRKKIGDLMVAAAPYIAIVLILAIFMLFFGEVVQPTISLGDKLVQTADKMDAILMRQDALLNNKQLLVSQLPVNGSGVPN